jgi:hypothetical protein
VTSFVSSPPVAGAPLAYTLVGQNIAYFTVWQGEERIATVVNPATDETSEVVTAVSSETPVARVVGDKRGSRTTVTATLQGAPPVVDAGPPDASGPPDAAPEVGPDAEALPACSEAYDERVELNVTNTSPTATYEAYWIDYACLARPAFTLGPGATRLESSFATHVFRFTDATTQEVVLEYVVPRGSPAVSITVP